jgi:hypothetical protein
MNIQILAERNANALSKIEKTAPIVCEMFAVGYEILPRLTATSKDKSVEAMQRMEAVGDLLEALTETGVITGTIDETDGEPGDSIPFFLERPAKELIEEIKTLDSVAGMDEMISQEVANKNRKTVVKALEDRISELTNEVVGG